MSYNIFLDKRLILLSFQSNFLHLHLIYEGKYRLFAVKMPNFYLKNTRPINKKGKGKH